MAAVINVPWLLSQPRLHWDLSRGLFTSEWDQRCFPESDPEGRRPVIWWSRCLLLGHSIVFLGGVVTGYWIIPVIVSMTPMYGSWLFYLCNNTQHCGLMDNVSDFRLNSRSFRLNRVVAFLYWKMNYHVEHHMYAAVPCYNLARLNQAIRHDLPSPLAGLLEVWAQIGHIMHRQRNEPNYQYRQPLPGALGSQQK